MPENSPKRCPHCHGLFGQVENCKTCKGSGTVSIDAVPVPKIPQPTDIIRRAGRQPKNDPGRLNYDTLVRLCASVDKIMDCLMAGGFDQALEMSLDDETTSGAMKRAFLSLIADESERQKKAYQAKGKSLPEPRPSELLRFARAIKDLKAVRREIGLSTIN